MNSQSVRKQLERNAVAHDALASTYEAKHSEIYNPIEQARIEGVIGALMGLTNIERAEVLDFGAGTGSLTWKFVARNCRVTAADVSARSLSLLRERIGLSRNVVTSLLSEEQLPFADASFDIVATYSVLHHVPDYLNAVREMARVLRPGGLLYIDHELSDMAWEPNSALSAYREATKLSRFAHLLQLIGTGELFTVSFIKTVFMKAFVDPRYEREGDLHVWPNDHIEWASIALALEKGGVAIIETRDYLLYQPRGGVSLYREYECRCGDTRRIFGRKLG